MAELLTDEELLEKTYHEEFEDYEVFSKEYLRIKTDEGEIVPFIFNTAQKKLHSIIKELEETKGKVWIIIYKPRQLGFSTFVQGYIFHNNLLYLHQKALTMGHRVDASNNLFDIYNRYYTYLPDGIKPKLKKSNEKKISYELLGSENKIDTAGAAEIGRSDTFQAVHLTEFAFYPDPKVTYLGLAQGAKKAKIFIIETTANGFNDFRDRWIDAMNGDSDFYPFFISWLEHEPYSKSFQNETEKNELLKTLGVNPFFNAYPDEEKLLIEKYNATLEQLNWRRWAILNLCNKDVEQFHQEYPNTWQEGFLASGRPVFDVRVCVDNQDKATEPFKVGYLEPIYNSIDPEYKAIIDSGDYDYEKLKKFMKGVQWVDSPKGDLKLHYDIKLSPLDKNRFCAGSDQSEGLEQGDPSVIKVLDRKEMKVCITWHGKTDLDLLAIEQHKIQVFLKGDLYTCNEKNIGQSTIIAGTRLGVNNYYAQDFDKGYPEDTQHVGFRTTTPSKKHIIDDLKEAIRESLFEDSEKGTWEEALTFVYDERGRVAAQNKIKDPGVRCYDDRIMTLALMWRCHLWLPNYKQLEVDTRMEWLKRLSKEKKRDRMHKSYMGV